MATISSPIGRTPRNAGAGANTYKKGGTTKMAGVMKNGGAKYQDKGAVTTKPSMSPAKIAVPGSSKSATPESRAKFMDMLKKGATSKPKGKAKSGGSMRGKK